MKNPMFRACLLAMFCVLGLGVATCYADSVGLTFNNVGGASYNGEYVYPYYFTINDGGKTTTNNALMCISYDRNINFGESWTADVVTAASQGTLYEEAAYFAALATAGGQTAIDAQLAAWSLFSKNVTLDAGAEALLAGLKNVDLSSYGHSLVYLAESGTQDWGGTPQDFIFAIVTPEPGTWALLGTGILMILGMIRFRKRSASPSSQLQF